MFRWRRKEAFRARTPSSRWATPRRTHSFRPFLEPLEDRTLPTGGPTFVVTNLNDSGAGSFRDAIQQANGSDSPATITFGISGTISLTSGPLAITNAVTIDGPGAGHLTVTANSQSGVFTDSASGPVSITGLTISGGSAAQGGAIDANPGTSLTITGCTLTGNTAASGGAIATAGTLTVSNSTFQNNTASDANLAQGGAVYLADSDGVRSQATITGSTFSGNLAIAGTAEGSEADGGAIYDNGNLTLADSTLVYNQAFGPFAGGGALYLDVQGSATITSATIDANSAIPPDPSTGAGGGGGIDNNGNLTLGNTIVANNTVTGVESAGPDIVGGLTSEGHNLFGNTSDIFSSLLSTDLQNVNPLLGPLANHGGPTATQLLLYGSPAFSAGDPEQAGVADQRGDTRPQRVDIGAVNLQPADHFAVTIHPNVQPVGVPANVVVTALDKYGETDFFYTGTVQFDSSDSLAQLPGNYTFNSADNGIHVFTPLVFHTPGFQALLVYDVANPLNVGLAGDLVLGNPPTVSVGPDEVLDAGQTLSESDSFEVPAPGAQALVNYGDGLGFQPLALNSNHTFTLQHTYTQEGTYQATVLVFDDGQVGSGSFMVNVLPRGSTSVNTARAQPGGTATVSSPGVEATLFNLDSSGRVATILVADVPSQVPAPGTLVAGSYEVRAVNVVDGDMAIITFQYANLGNGLPTLTFFNRATGTYEMVQGSALLGNAIFIDPIHHTITLILDSSSFPSILSLTGTVFTITVPQTTSTSSQTSIPLPVSSSTSAGLTGPGEGSGSAQNTSIGGSTGLATFTLVSGTAGLTVGGGDEWSGTDSPLLSDLPPAKPSATLLPAVTISPSQADAFQATEANPAPAPLPPPLPGARAPEVLPGKVPLSPLPVEMVPLGVSFRPELQPEPDSRIEGLLLSLAMVSWGWVGSREEAEEWRQRNYDCES